MDNGSGIFSCSVDSGMEQHTSFVHAEIGAALINDTSIGINFEQTRRCHFTVQKSKRMNQEALLVRRRANLANETDIDCCYNQFLTRSTLAAVHDKTTLDNFGKCLNYVSAAEQM